MYIENERDLNYIMQQLPEFADDFSLVSVDFLNADQRNKYSLGVHGIGKAHFYVSSGKVMVNPTQALILLAKAYAFDRTEKILNTQREQFARNYDKIKRALWPKNREPNNMSDGFYRRLFGSALPNDTFRNVDNSELNKRIFQMEIVPRFEVVEPKTGSKYTEEQIREINEQLYLDAVAAKKEDSRGLTTLQLCIVEEEVATSLKEFYGWKFSYREYKLQNIDWEIIDAIGAAFPTLQKAVEDAANMAYITQGDKCTFGNALTGAHLVESDISNPLTQTPVYKRLRNNQLRKVLDLVKFHQSDFELLWVNNLLSEDERWNLLGDYIYKLSYSFVNMVEHMRCFVPDENKIPQLAEELTNYIISKMIYSGMIN